MVHPWGIDDGQGWKTPEPAGVCDFCTPAKNALAGRHTREVINPFLKSLRGKVGVRRCTACPATEDPIRKKLYRSFTHRPTDDGARKAGARSWRRSSRRSRTRASRCRRALTLSKDRPVIDYFKQFPGLDAGPRYNGAGFWDLPDPGDQGRRRRPRRRGDLRRGRATRRCATSCNKHSVRHVLLTGYATDMCFCRTTAGYQNLAKDFNVFLVGDATLATFPANDTPRTPPTPPSRSRRSTI